MRACVSAHHGKCFCPSVASLAPTQTSFGLRFPSPRRAFTRKRSRLRERKRQQSVRRQICCQKRQNGSKLSRFGGRQRNSRSTNVASSTSSHEESLWQTPYEI